VCFYHEHFEGWIREGSADRISVKMTGLIDAQLFTVKERINLLDRALRLPVLP
jgi:hypothetical protein